MEATNERTVEPVVMDRPGYRSPDNGHGNNLRGEAVPPVAAETVNLYTYARAYRLCVEIDAGLTSGRAHWRTRDGVLLRTLDEVVRAILDGELSEAQK